MLDIQLTPADSLQGYQGCPKVLVVTILTYIFAAPVSANKTSCSVTHLESGSLSVECTYPVNLREASQSISLMHFGTNGYRSDVAYSCAWEDKKPICIGERGFYSPESITNQITFEVFHPHNNAEFACDTIPPDDALTVERCRPEKTGGDSTPTIVVSTEPPTTLTSTLTPTDRKECSCSSYIAAIAVLAILLTASSAACVFFFFKLTQRKSPPGVRLQDASEPSRTGSEEANLRRYEDLNQEDL